MSKRRSWNREVGQVVGKVVFFHKKNKRLRTENPTTTTLNANKIILIFLSSGVSWESLIIQVRLAYD